MAPSTLSATWDSLAIPCLKWTHVTFLSSPSRGSSGSGCICPPWADAIGVHLAAESSLRSPLPSLPSQREAGRPVQAPPGR